MKVKEESEKASLRFNIQKTKIMASCEVISLQLIKINEKKKKIMASGPIASWEIEGETVETVSNFLGFQNHCRW